MQESKSIFKSKTFWINFGVGSTLILQDMLMQDPMIQANPAVIGGLTAANIFLRSITSKPVHVTAPEVAPTHHRHR